MDSADVVIAGSGIAGIATAWQVAEQLGATTAVLVDPRPPLSLTSDRPGANYRDWWPQRTMVELAQRSIGSVERLVAAGAAVAMDRRGYLYVTADPSVAETLPSIIERHVAAGVARTDADLWLGRDDLTARFPHLGRVSLGAIHARRAGSLDTVGLGRTMLAAAQLRGVRVERGTVVAVGTANGHVERVTVTTADGHRRIHTDRFVNAAGPFALAVARLVGVDLQLETVLRQKVVFRDPLAIVPRDAPFTIGLDETDGLPAGVHIKPDASIGPDAIKLGWARDQTPSEPSADPACPPDFPAAVLARAATMVPGLEAYVARAPDLLAHDGGFYARTPDGLPLIGPLGPDGAFIVGGMAGFGTMMAAAAGELGAAWVLGGDRPDLAQSFDPRRSAVGRRVDGSAAPRYGEL